MTNKDVEMHAIISGRVQGVGFRYLTEEVANGLGLLGTVQNLPDGSVEIYAQGNRENLELLLENLKGRLRFAHIEDVKTDFYKPIKSFKNFQII